MQAFDSLQNVCAKAFLIRQPRAFFENAAFNAAAEMFNEIAVELRIDLADDSAGIELDARGLRAGLAALLNSRCGGQQSGELTAGNGHSKRLHYSKRAAS